MTHAGEIVSSLMGLVDYGEKRSHLFPSVTSLAWFVRQNKEQLIERSALLMIAGRWFVSPAIFDSYILEAGKEAAIARHPSRKTAPTD